MIFATDRDYIETKQIKQGLRQMNPDFIPMARWIAETYGIAPLNIWYDTFGKEQRPRLQICLEYTREESTFKDERQCNPDKKKQAAIASQFAALTTVNKSVGEKLKQLFTGHVPADRYNTDKMHVYFSSFERVAQQEVIHSVARGKLKHFEEQLNCGDIWQIMPDNWPTVFLYTDEQVKQHTQNNKVEEWSILYYEMLQSADEFGYITPGAFRIRLDSKENFEKNYGGNWYYYWK